MAGTMMVKSMRSAAATKELRRLELRQHQQRAAQAERHHHQADESGDVAQGHDDRAANPLLQSSVCSYGAPNARRSGA